MKNSTFKLVVCLMFVAVLMTACGKSPSKENESANNAPTVTNVPIDDIVTTPTNGSVIPTPISPSGIITTTIPTYTWSKIEGVTKYQYQLYQGDTRIDAKTVTASVCGTTECASTQATELSAGNFKWRVCAYVDGVWRSTSAFMEFTVENSN